MSWFIKIFSSILAVFIFSSSAEIAAYSPIDKDNMLTSFTVISDAHLEGNNRQKHTLFGELLLDTASAEVKSSALVMCGDNTMNGQTVEKSMLYGLIDKYNTIDNVLMAAGNHDICPGKHNSGDYDDLKKDSLSIIILFLIIR
ncbi:MAG: metallophosphoesterase [Eubacterium sp.]|nr:metallophosphoesterase [Eubacterium sp.]